MTTSYQVETGDVVISDALLKIAEDNGWKEFPAANEHRPWLIVSVMSPNGGYSGLKMQDYETLTIPEFIALLRKGPTPKKPPIVIGHWEVIFEKEDEDGNSGIMVGCRFISTATVDAIHARIHADD